MAFNWTCPHCGTLQAVSDAKYKPYFQRIYMDHQAEGKIGVQMIAVGCVSPECKRHSVSVILGTAKVIADNWALDDKGQILYKGSIYPQGAAKPQPDYIPAPLREDYIEACLIRELSPKAAATLVRRCLQGMIRDFTGITKGRLVDEIKALREAVGSGKAPDGVTHDSIEAIDAVRDIGNIGAHMEKDINIIVDVDPGEAQALIELVELLFDEWYVARERRKTKLKAIEDMASLKKQQLANLKAVQGAKSSPPVAGPGGAAGMIEP